MRFILFFCFSLLYGKYYSIQVFSSNKINYSLKVYKDVKNYPFARIEYIKKYYTVRVGLDENINNLKPLLKKIKLKYKDAFLRNVKFLKQRIIICNCIKKRKRELIFNLLKKELQINVKNNRQNKIKINKKEIKFAPYIKLSMALLKNDKEELKKIVKIKRLPYKDKVEALIKIGMINKAANQIYKNLKNNSLDYFAYKQAVDFYTFYADRLKFSSFWQKNDKISSLNNEFEIKSYNKGIKFNQNILIKNNNKLYKNLKNFYYLNIFIRDKKLKTDITFNKFDKIFTGIKFDFNLYPNKMNLQLALNQKSDESIYLLYGGKKHFVNLIFNYFLDNSHYITSNIKYNLFYSQNNKYIGNGENFNIRYTNNLRIGYPDFSYYLFLNQGVYNQSDKADTLMKKFSSVDNFNILPAKFYIIGSGLSFGINRLGNISPEFLPFWDVSLNYELLNKNLGYNILLGLRRKFFYEDNLMMGINYSKVLNKANTNPFIKFILKYYYWF